MIAKKYRLPEREMRKVLSKGKPFFSYMLITNTLRQEKGSPRFGILLSGKVARGSVNRNFWRRKYYDLIYSLLPTLSYDIVFMPKKGTILDFKDQTKVEEFEKNVIFLVGKIRENCK